VQVLTERKAPTAGSRLTRAILRMGGWRVFFDGLPETCGVIIIYPHTSNWDFVVGMLAKWAMGISAAFLGKDTLFRVPILGRCMRYWGGIAIDRSGSHGVIAGMAARLREASARGEQLWLAVAPEGTRKLGTHWKRGFYHITVEAGVPIGLAFFDYARREVGLTEFFHLTGDEATDLARIAAYYVERGSGRNPSQATPIRFAP